MKEYLDVFIDEEYPTFLDKYLNTQSVSRLKGITQFCGCDYTNLYHPKFLYTRFDHSLVVAHMTWHFSKDKKETIAALLHDIGTPCFAHCIDYVFGDYINQESSEKKIADVIMYDEEIRGCLESDGIKIDELSDFSTFNILENKSPKLCTDRLDGILHTCYIWLQTASIEEIREVYENLIVLQNEDGIPEIGFKNKEVAEKFASMTYCYAKELQGNRDKFVMGYISEIIKLAVKRNLVTLDDLYFKSESEICNLFSSSFSSWKTFQNSTNIRECDEKPDCDFYISFDTKKRNAIPLVRTLNATKRIDQLSHYSKKIFDELYRYHSKKYAFINNIDKLE